MVMNVKMVEFSKANANWFIVHRAAEETINANRKMMPALTTAAKSPAIHLVLVITSADKLTL